MSGLEVINPGILTLLQDTGRFGYGHHGISQGGALDLHAYCWANYLLGNTMECPQLEITLGQAAFRAKQDMTIALAGADASASVNGCPVKCWSTFLLRSGEVLRFGAPTKGMRTYLAVKGGFIVPKTFGSVSTVMRDKLGGLVPKGASIGQGMPLGKGDILLVTHNTSYKNISTEMPVAYIPQYGDDVTLRMIESCQAETFSADSKTVFYNGTYVITPESNRMGYRLKGAPINQPSESGIISEGIALGAVQVPADGQPIILLNDRQTLGGYRKLGCVARVDLSLLAQSMPGTAVRFVPGDIEVAIAELVQFLRFFNL